MMRRNAEELSGEKPHCPHCEGIELRRQGRVGFMQRVVLPRFGWFPWECGLCRKVYFLKQRTTEYRQHSHEGSLGSMLLEPATAPGLLPEGLGKSAL